MPEQAVHLLNAGQVLEDEASCGQLVMLGFKLRGKVKGAKRLLSYGIICLYNHCTVLTLFSYVIIYRNHRYFVQKLYPHIPSSIVLLDWSRRSSLRLVAVCCRKLFAAVSVAPVAFDRP